MNQAVCSPTYGFQVHVRQRQQKRNLGLTVGCSCCCVCVLRLLLSKGGGGGWWWCQRRPRARAPLACGRVDSYPPLVLDGAWALPCHSVLCYRVLCCVVLCVRPCVLVTLTRTYTAPNDAPAPTTSWRTQEDCIRHRPWHSRWRPLVRASHILAGAGAGMQSEVCTGEGEALQS